MQYSNIQNVNITTFICKSKIMSQNVKRKVSIIVFFFFFSLILFPVSVSNTKVEQPIRNQEGAPPNGATRRELTRSHYLEGAEKGQQKNVSINDLMILNK